MAPKINEKSILSVILRQDGFKDCLLYTSDAADE